MASDEGFIDVGDGVRLYFRAIGAGDAVVIPLACWTEEFDVLAGRRRVIFYDPRSRGGSTTLDLAQISFENDIRDLEAVRASLGLERVSLIGWSYFGGVVARYAMENPEHVERLVMVCGPPMRRVPHSGAINRMMAERLEAVAPGFLHEVQGASSLEPKKARRLWDLLKQVRTGRPSRPVKSTPARYDNERPEKVAAVFTRALQTQGDWDWRDDARRVTSPALYVFGTADIMPAEAVREWAEFLPNARILVLDGVGHHPSVEDPERFFPALDTFLGGQWPEGATRDLVSSKGAATKAPAKNAGTKA